MGIILRTQALSRHFGGVRAVDDVSLSIGENELRSIIGPNGAGKTTLFNVITGKIPATSGRVVYQDREITNKKPHEIAMRGITRTFQRSSIFLGLTVLENVRIAKQVRSGGSLRVFSSRESLKSVSEAAWAILDQLGLSDQAETPARNLSHGDQRLLEIGIALAGEPKLLLLDEPTAGMSPRETERTTRLITQLTRDIAIILVEHDMDVVMNISDRISVLHQGHLIAEGTPDEIRANETVKEAYLGKEG